MPTPFGTAEGVGLSQVESQKYLSLLFSMCYSKVHSIAWILWVVVAYPQ